MQLVLNNDSLNFVIDYVVLEGDKRVQRCPFSEIRSVIFAYPKVNYFTSFSQWFMGLAAIVIGADKGSPFSKKIAIHIEMKNGTTVSEDVYFGSIKEAKKLEEQLERLIHKSA